MLLELRIRDFAIIEEAALQFGPGLNVLSGETGAGKTIIMSALAMLLGARASAELIRVDRKEAAVEARFDLAGDTEFPRDAEQLHRGDQPGGDQSELLVRRVIAEGGAYLNNAKVPAVGTAPLPADLLCGRYLVLRRGKRTVGGVEVRGIPGQG